MTRFVIARSDGPFSVEEMRDLVTRLERDDKITTLVGSRLIATAWELREAKEAAVKRERTLRDVRADLRKHFGHTLVKQERNDG